jgi:hypothetical protein
MSLFKLIYQVYRVKLISKKKLSLRKLSSTYLFNMKEESSSYLGSSMSLGSFSFISSSDLAPLNFFG